MDWIGIAFTVFGIAVSIVTFFIGYRSTIGARKERVRSGKDEVEKILVRRIVLEHFEPTPDEISRIIDTKARDFRIRSTDLLSKEQLLDNIYTRIVESDFIPPKQREEILESLNRTIDKIHPTLSHEQSLEEAVAETSTARMTSNAVMVMAASATIAGMLFSVLPNFPRGLDNLTEMWPLLLSTAAISLTLIVFMSVAYKFRERQQEEPSKPRIQFENDVLRLLMDRVHNPNIKIKKTPISKQYDIDVDRNGEKIIIEVKNWQHRIFSSLIAREISRLEGILTEENASLAILVVPRKISADPTSNSSEKVRIMTPRELQKYLK